MSDLAKLHHSRYQQHPVKTKSTFLIPRKGKNKKRNEGKKSWRYFIVFSVECKHLTLKLYFICLVDKKRRKNGGKKRRV